jgi:signal transduction histidine kinase
VAALARPRAGAAGQELRVTCPAELIVPLDAAQVHQALLNLVGNALDAAPAGTVIALRAERRSGGDVALCVSQPGASLPSEVQERLFEPFFTTKAGGTGLGLAISRKIARDHGGDLVLSKDGPDRVEFTFLVPADLSSQPGCTHGPHLDR